MDNLGKMDTFLGIYSLLRLNHEDIKKKINRLLKRD